MRRLLSLALLLLPFTATAGLLDPRQGEERFLPVSQAFVISAELRDPQTVRVHWDIAEGYYLYRHQLRFRLADASGLALGEPQLPDGLRKTDEYFGEIEAYYHRLDALLPIVNGAATDGSLMLEVRFQGCAERGLCYPPETVTLPLLAPAAAAQAAPDTGAVALPSEQDRLAQLIGERSLLLVVLAFFGFGLLLALTPCVLPMLPILSGIIAGAGARVSALRGLSLSAAYVLAMALAYTVFGIVAGLTGANLQAAMQHPAVIVGFSVVFVLLALSMFGLFQLQLPVALQSWLSQQSNRQRGGSLAGAGVMGFLSALIVGPCIAPPLAGALLYIGNTGDALLGGSALFALGLGMGTPLLALGVVEGGLLPRAGRWMDLVKHLFGFMLLGVAVWMLGRILPLPVTSTLWGLLALSLAIYLLAGAGGQRWRFVLAAAAIVYGAALLWGTVRGGVDPLRPWQAFRPSPGQPADRAAFLPVKSVEDLELLLAEAARQQRPVLLDFYADWCVACLKMEHEVFGDPAVRAALGNVLLLRADVTANDVQDRALLKALGVYGPPTLLFFAADGQERRDLRLVGETDSAGLLARLHRLDGR
ncbi:MAG TPA: protein-disulfide reductase DsbD [Nevskiales bacterium]|nr:protein-disulfide reductase DsbD [Nevskiales bacterium]